ncbi:hypothetical protein PR048_013099 [Dryococelus australis]|uniref:Uncharacterized protein n=1 Tax=Dryococelus australis TaxID=614101 RepID=A0ABQ9HRA6_9NEOP|nr:hypothetical protein PR048_013099 [Dryococelus australis]
MIIQNLNHKPKKGRSKNRKQEIEDLIKERNRKSRQYQQSRTQQFKNELDRANRLIRTKVEVHKI